MFSETKVENSMNRSQALQSFSKELHISHNQIFTYLNCSLKYRFQYVEGRFPERISIVLPFGGAIHAAIEMLYRAIKAGKATPSADEICNRFEDVFTLDLGTNTFPLIFKKDLPDKAAAVEIGMAMMRVFHEAIDKDFLKNHEVIDVELPLSANLYTDVGQVTEFKLIGIIDLMLRDHAGEIVIVDNKTAAKPMSQSAADDNNQMTAYSYLLAANKVVFPTASVKCRFDVLRKLKTPKLKQVWTTRTAAQRRRFAKVANAVLSGIDAGIFIPQPSWMCADCAYANACQAW